MIVSGVRLSGLRISPRGEAWTGDIIAFTGNNGSQSPSMVNNWYRRAIIMWVYTAAELQAAFGQVSTTIRGLRLSVVQQPTYQPYPNYAIGMKNGTFVGNPGSTGYTVVKSQSSESFTTGTIKTFTFDTPFAWTGGDLAIVAAWGQSPTNYSASGIQPMGAGTSYYSWTDSAGVYVINTDSANSTVTQRPVVQLFG